MHHTICNYKLARVHKVDFSRLVLSTNLTIVATVTQKTLSRIYSTVVSTQCCKDEDKKCMELIGERLFKEPRE